MKKNKKKGASIVLIGSGNVGTQLGKRLYKRGQNVVQVFSRKAKKAERLADAIGAKWTTDLTEVLPDADLYILAVHDDFIDDVAAILAKVISPSSFLVHTSGATPSTVFKPFFRRYGVFYPLQTFNIHKKPKWSRIPVCIYANKKNDMAMLEMTARAISKKVFVIDDKQRSVAHVAAVFANNFSNHVFAIAGNILKKEKLSFELIRPLILETAEKVKNGDPGKMQTGPAVRGDDETIERHLKYLDKFDDWKAVYELLTRQIKKYHS